VFSSVQWNWETGDKQMSLSQVTERAERYESAIEELTARIKNVSRLRYYQFLAQLSVCLCVRVLTRVVQIITAENCNSARTDLLMNSDHK